jgi:hypothetical protein
MASISNDPGGTRRIAGMEPDDASAGRSPLCKDPGGLLQGHPGGVPYFGIGRIGADQFPVHQALR